jgi:hypothetical protein
MRFRSIIALAAAGALCLTNSPAANAASDDWVHTGHHVALAADVVDVGALLAPVGTVGSCSAVDSGITVYTITVDTWYQPTTGRIDYEWHGGGEAWAKRSCASSATVQAQVCDYAGAGYPATICSPVLSATSSTVEGDRFIARVTVDLRVRYYDPANLYMRGHGVVRNRVSGSYTPQRSPGQASIGCRETVTSVTPTPAGPQMTSSEPAPCTS